MAPPVCALPNIIASAMRDGAHTTPRLGRSMKSQPESACTQSVPVPRLACTLPGIHAICEAAPLTTKDPPMTSRESAANRVLASIPPSEYKRLRSQLEPITVDFGQVLYEPGQAIRHELRFVPIQTSRAVHGTCMLSRRQIDGPGGHVRDCPWCRVSNRYRRHALIQESAYRPFDQCAAIQGFVQRRLGDECVSPAFELGSALAGQSPARCKKARAGSTGSRSRRRGVQPVAVGTLSNRRDRAFHVLSNL